MNRNFVEGRAHRDESIGSRPVSVELWHGRISGAEAVAGYGQSVGWTGGRAAGRQAGRQAGGLGHRRCVAQQRRADGRTTDHSGRRRSAPRPERTLRRPATMDPALDALTLRAVIRRISCG